MNDFIKINFEKNYFDCIISLHTIYHINKNIQRDVILKMLRISKKGAPIIIVYSNPKTFINFLKKILFFKKKKNKLYFYCYPNKWWLQFREFADVNIYPWRSFSSNHQKILFPDNVFGKVLFKIFYFLEETFPSFFARYFQYQIIVLKKK